MSLFSFYRKKKEVENFKLLKEKYPDLEFELSFKVGTLEIEDILDLLENQNIGYKIEYHGYELNSINESLKKFRKMKKKTFFETTQMFLDSQEECRLSASHIFPAISPAVYRVMWQGTLDKFNIEAFEKLFKHPGFVCAYLFWRMDEFYQNFSKPVRYEQRGLWYNKDWIYKDKWGEQFIKIDGNPGRSRQVCNMMLRSCWRMWFGKNAFELISKEKVERFSNCRINKVLENGIHFIELYENPYESYLNENRKIQKEFNEWIDIEGIYKMCLEKGGLKIGVKI